MMINRVKKPLFSDHFPQTGKMVLTNKVKGCKHFEDLLEMISIGPCKQDKNPVIRKFKITVITIIAALAIFDAAIIFLTCAIAIFATSAILSHITTYSRAARHLTRHCEEFACHILQAQRSKMWQVNDAAIQASIFIKEAFLNDFTALITMILKKQMEHTYE